MSDALLIAGLFILAVAGFLFNVFAGLAVVGASLMLFALASADRQGPPWRS